MVDGFAKEQTQSATKTYISRSLSKTDRACLQSMPFVDRHTTRNMGKLESIVYIARRFMAEVNDQPTFPGFVAWLTEQSMDLHL